MSLMSFLFLCWMQPVTFVPPDNSVNLYLLLIAPLAAQQQRSKIQHQTNQYEAG